MWKFLVYWNELSQHEIVKLFSYMYVNNGKDYPKVI